ncbi:MAG: Crp/Fnr family transcriptional regulator [Saprospiraceae bacterium]|nr:Crp/Fnr family transcriptional regulator [Saprospiraceae bacterium]
MDFIPFDIKCYSKLEERFQTIFEPKLINEICQDGNLRIFKPNETLIDIGMLITHMPLLISGSIKILTEDEKGDELLLYFLELGETCAVTLNCCTRKAKSTIRAITETDCEILFVPVEKMEHWMIKYKSWRAYVLDSYNERLNEMVKAIDNIVFHSLEHRIKTYLKDKAWMAKSAILHISHQDIANDLYSSRVAVSRIMKKLESENFIEQQRNKIIIVEYNK